MACITSSKVGSPLRPPGAGSPSRTPPREGSPLRTPVGDTPSTPQISVDEPSLAKDFKNDRSHKNPLGHQGGKVSGGTDANQRVLYCSNISLTLDYQGLYMIIKQFGKVERMKMKLAEGGSSFICYITFYNSISADEACRYLHGHSINDVVVRAALYNIKNLNHEPYDFIPKDSEEDIHSDVSRTPPTPVWHVATYKDGRENLIKASECIQSKVGNIPYGNLKHYGKNILIKAGNATQAALLNNFKAPESSNVKTISPHRSFNTLKGVIYSKDLFEFEENEILHRCPSSVYEVRKFRGSNNAILLSFNSEFLPEFISIVHSRIKVKKYIPSPSQCYNCFEYGHTFKHCSNAKKCKICSAMHDEWSGCSLDHHCFHCNGNHSPNSRQCDKYKFEQEVVVVASNEHVSIGSAKRRVMGANKILGSSYAQVIKTLKTRKEGGNKSDPHRDVASNPQPSTSGTAKSSTKGQQKSKTIPQKSQPKPQRSPAKPRKSLAKTKQPQMDSLESTTISMESSCESLPNLNETSAVPSHKVTHSTIPTSMSESEDGGTKSISLETPSSIITVTKKPTNENDDFTFPHGGKRARPASPKSGNVVETSNSFSPLQESPCSKKQALCRDATSQMDSADSGEGRLEVEDCVPRGKNVEEKSRSGGKMDTKIPSISTKILPISAPSAGGSRKTKLSKENFLKVNQDKAPQSKKDKTGKKTT